jgi:hypothetical protein
LGNRVEFVGRFTVHGFNDLVAVHTYIHWQTLPGYLRDAQTDAGIVDLSDNSPPMADKFAVRPWFCVNIAELPCFQSQRTPFRHIRVSQAILLPVGNLTAMQNFRFRTIVKTKRQLASSSRTSFAE